MTDIRTPLAEDTDQHDPVVTESPVPEESENAAEHYRLGARPPLRTLVSLSVGPLISQIVTGLNGIITSMWMARAMSTTGMSAISLYSNLDGASRAFGFFMNCAASSRISALLGQDRGAEAGQLICDLLRCCLIFGAIVPIIFLPCAIPLAHWFGANDEVTHWGTLYLFPLLACSPITCLFLLLCGCLQAEGRSILVGGIQIASLAANMAFFNPIFLLIFKWKTPGAAVATTLSELIPSIVLVILYFRGTFGVKPVASGLLKKFSPFTFPALRVGVSQLFMNLSRSIPSILLRKFMGLCAENGGKGTFDDAIAGFNGVARIYALSDSVRLAVSMGLLPACSYAFAGKNVSRFMWLVLHACWLNLMCAIPIAFLGAFGSRQLAMTISGEESYLKWAAPMLKIANWETPFGWIRNVIQTVLQALQYGITATLYSFFGTFVVYIACGFVIYNTDNTDFVRMMWVIPIHAGIAVVIGLGIVVFPLRKVWRTRDQVEVDTVGPAEDIEEEGALELQDQTDPHPGENEPDPSEV
jgi:Na+-driven multidrug efflux pump